MSKDFFCPYTHTDGKPIVTIELPTILIKNRDC